MQRVIYEVCIGSGGRAVGFVIGGVCGFVIGGVCDQWRAWHALCMQICLGSNYASDSLKISGNKTHFIQTEYFGKISKNIRFFLGGTQSREFIRSDIARGCLNRILEV